jgi:translation elongation factor EF-Tu-like GTPase
VFRMTVDDVFSIRGRGTVLTGKVELGPLSVGEEVWINDRGPLRVDGIEAFRKNLQQADAGVNVGLLFGKLDRNDVKAGDVVQTTGL